MFEFSSVLGELKLYANCHQPMQHHWNAIGKRRLEQHLLAPRQSDSFSKSPLAEEAGTAVKVWPAELTFPHQVSLCGLRVKLTRVPGVYVSAAP